MVVGEEVSAWQAGCWCENMAWRAHWKAVAGTKGKGHRRKKEKPVSVREPRASLRTRPTTAVPLRQRDLPQERAPGSGPHWTEHERANFHPYSSAFLTFRVIAGFKDMQLMGVVCECKHLNH